MPGELAGKQVQPREIAELAYAAGVVDSNDLALAVMICLAESQGFDHAINDNLDNNGKLLSRDVGMWQINIKADQVGTDFETSLYDRKTNARAMFQLFQNRGWTPWVAYVTGVCYHDTYLQRGCNGVLNFLVQRRVVEAKGKQQYQKTPVPLFSIKQLPYYQSR